MLDFVEELKRYNDTVSVDVSPFMVIKWFVSWKNPRVCAACKTSNNNKKTQTPFCQINEDFKKQWIMK